MFLRQHWYVAALTSELSQRPIARTILGEPVAIYRNERGRVVAIADQCPHRGYPLSLGTVVDDVLVCGYHGFTYDCEGLCVAVPGQDRIPTKLAVRTYPVAEKGCWLWIWMGHAEPDLALLPDTPWLEPSESWSLVSGVAKIDASFPLLVDNLLDLSHETFLHNSSIGTPEVATTPIEVEVDDEARIVNVYRHMADVECPPFYATTTGLAGTIDRWQDIEYLPPGLTPSTETSVYDFWALSRDFCLGDAAIDSALDKMQIAVVQEDVDALNIIQQRINSGREITEISVKIDRGGLAARHMLAQMGEDELTRQRHMTA